MANHAKLNVQLRVYIYADQMLMDLARPSLITAVVVLIAGLLIAIPKDVQWSRSRRHGRRLKGPELLSVRQFNRRTRADGISFMQTPRLSAKLLGLQPALAIPRAIESSHLLIMGDSGTGKSALIRQLLSQLEQETMDSMRAGQGQHSELVGERTREAIARDYGHLNQSQAPRLMRFSPAATR